MNRNDSKIKVKKAFPFPKNHFDMVMSHDVLEHLHVSPYYRSLS
jgi:hypothetical protein